MHLLVQRFHHIYNECPITNENIFADVQYGVQYEVLEKVVVLVSLVKSSRLP